MKKVLQSIVLLLGVLMLPTVVYAQNMYADVNGDLEVNIADINAVIGVILSDVSNPSADVNGDGEVNIADINAVIDFILNGGIDPHLLEVCEKVVEIDNEIIDYYEQCSSIDELMTHKDEIEAMDGVEYVFSNDNTTMYVVIKDFGTVFYSYYPWIEETNNRNVQYPMTDRIKTSANATHDHAIEQTDAKALILFHMSKDKKYASLYDLCEKLNENFNRVHIESKIEPSFDIEFFRDGLFDYDYVYLLTHGGYEFDEKKHEEDSNYSGLHWLLTTEELPSDEDKAIERLAEIRKQYDEQDVSYGGVYERRNGEDVPVRYFTVSDHFIESSNRSFNHFGKAIVFNAACHSMRGPGIRDDKTDTISYNFGQVFAQRGAGAYFGYDQTNSHGKFGAIQYYCNLLSGMSINSAFDNLQFTIQHDYKFKDPDISWWADLIPYIPSQEFLNTCIVKPSFEYKDNSIVNKLSISLNANISCGSYDYTFRYSHNADGKTIETKDSNTDDLSSILKYGFELSESEQFTDVTRLDEMQIGDDGCSWNEETFNLDFSQSLTYCVGQVDSKIMPNTTYWARAYVYDGQGYNYSEPITFTTGSIEDNFPQTETFTVNGVSFKMVAVEGGTFMMGATAEQVDAAESNEYPVHQVTLSSYSIGQTEVTQALWQAVMGSNPSYFTGDLNRPVEDVSWNDCQTFITKLNQMTGKNFRLPTEAEWEYAARGGNRSKGYKYSGSNDIGSVAWYEENADNVSDRGTRPVATKAPNELGLYDMSGNVWEWCQDWFDNDYGSNSPTENPTGPESGYNRVFRGGSWGYNAAFCRVSRRGSYIPTYHWRSGGLRLVMSGEPEPESERDVLIKLFMDTNGSLWTRNDNWCSDKPLSVWYGLSLDGEYVRTIDLRNNNLSGNVEIKRFNSLFNLLLTGNNLSSVSIESCPSLDLGYGFRGLDGIVLDELNISNCFSGYGQHFLSNVNITSINFSNMTALGRMFFDVITSNEITLNNCQFEGQGLLIEDNSNVGSLTVDHCVIPSGLLGGNVDDLIIRDSNIGDWWVIGARSSITIINSYIEGHLVNISGTPEEVDSYIRSL